MCGVSLKCASAPRSLICRLTNDRTHGTTLVAQMIPARDSRLYGNTSFSRVQRFRTKTFVPVPPLPLPRPTGCSLVHTRAAHL